MGQALRGRRQDVVLATKLFLPLLYDDTTPEAGLGAKLSARWRELRRLDTDRIDLYQLHRFDLDTDPEEMLIALCDLVHPR